MPHAQAHVAPEAPVVADDPLRQYLRLGVGAEMYAAPIAAVREILEVGQLTVLPQTPPFVRGVMNLRGAVVPVIDLGARFGAAPAALGKRSCIVVVDIAGDRGAADGEALVARHVVGMLVDAVYEVFEAADSALEAVPPMGTRVAPEHLQAMARVRGQVCGVLALDHLLGQAELASLIADHTASPVH